MNDLQRRETARLNRQRGAAMERRIARELRGNRVPMSGAGAIKGDCTVPLDEHRSIYVECKLTSRKKENQYAFVIPHLWFSKIEFEAKAMRTVFGILVIHWHGLHEDWIFAPVDKLHYLAESKDINLDHWIHAPIYESGDLKERLTFTYYRNKFLNGPIIFTVPDAGKWVVINLKDFKKVLHSEEKNARSDDSVL